MPELPEVETVRRSLEPRLIGQTIEDIEVRFSGAIVGDTTVFENEVIGQTFFGIERYGKYLAFRFTSGSFIMMHLRMTGRAVVVKPSEPMDRHCRVRFFMSREQELRFSDMRKFGRIAFVSDREALLALFTLGPEPLTDAFTVDALGHALRGRAKVKSVLLDQRRIAGLGNIYVDESLFRAGIHPERTVDTLSRDEVLALHSAIEDALSEALEHGGTTLRDYVQGDGTQGEYQNKLRVYGRSGEPCTQCGTQLQRLRVVGRGTTYCPTCQR